MKPKSTPLISIVIPIYNACKYLQKAVDSVLNQSFIDWELILVDDGSKDGSGNMCDQIAATDDRIRVFHIPNGGVTAARSYGVSRASGEWICFVDADDTLLDGALQAMLDHSDGCDIVIGNKQIICGDRVTDEVMNTRCEQLSVLDFLSGLIKNRISQYITGRIFRKSLFEDGTIDIPRYLIMAEDFIMNVQLGNKARRVALIPDMVYGYHVYDESVSHTFRTSLAYEEVFCNYLEKALRQGPYADSLREEIVLQKVRALKAAFMSQKGKVDMKNSFLRSTRREAKTVALTRGWKLFLLLLPLKKYSYHFFNLI